MNYVGNTVYSYTVSKEQYVNIQNRRRETKTTINPSVSVTSSSNPDFKKPPGALWLASSSISPTNQLNNRAKQQTVTSTVNRQCLRAPPFVLTQGSVNQGDIVCPSHLWLPAESILGACCWGLSHVPLTYSRQCFTSRLTVWEGAWSCTCFPLPNSVSVVGYREDNPIN